jgi:HK97 family phage prohead protease
METLAAAQAAAKRYEGKSMTVPNTQFKIYSGALKAYEADSKRRLKTVASSTIKDLAGDSMTENAINKMAESAKDRMTIFLNHSYDVPEDVFGSVEDVTVQRRGEYVDLDFDISLNDSNPRAVQTWDAINKGTKLGTSIGAKILDGWQDKQTGGYVFDDVTLLEASIVGIPANPRSWVEYAVKSFTDTSTVVKTEIRPDAEKATVTVDVSKGEAEEPKDERTAVDAGKDEPEKDEVGPTEDNTPAASTDTETHPEQETAPDVPVPDPQEAQKSVPEDGEGRVPPLDHDLAELMGLKSALSLLTKTTGELVEARKALGDEQAAHSITKAKLAEAKREQKAMKAIIEKVSSLPIGRRAQFDDQVQQFRTRFAHMYDEDFLHMLETTND